MRKWIGPICLTLLLFIRQAVTAQERAVTVKVLLDSAYRLVNKPGEQKNDLSKARAYAIQAFNRSLDEKDLRSEGRAATLLSQVFREGGDRNEGHKWSEKAYKLLERTRFHEAFADAAVEASSYYTLEGEDLKKKVGLYKVVVERYRQAGTKLKQADALKYLGDLTTLTGDFVASYKFLTSALNIYQALGHKEIRDLYDLLGYNCMSLSMSHDALKYGLEAVKMIEAQGDTSISTSTSYNRLGITYQVLKDYSHAGIFFEKALRIAERYHDTSSVLVIAANLSESYRARSMYRKQLSILQQTERNYQIKDPYYRMLFWSKSMDVYARMKDMDNAAVYAKRLADFLSGIDRHDVKYANLTIKLAQYYLLENQFLKARGMLKDVSEICEKQGNISQLAAVSLCLFRADSAQGDLKGAIAHFKKYKFWQDSLLNQKSKHDLGQMNALYESEKKDRELQTNSRDIALLREKDKLSESQIKNEILLRNITVIGTCLAILIAFIIYRRYRSKQRTNERLERQQEEINDQNSSLKTLLLEREWLLKEIHHRVKNNLQIVISLLNTQSAFLNDEQALFAIRNSQHRMHAMSLIHQKLYQSESLSGIDLAVYIRELVAYLRDSYETESKISYQVDAQSLMLDVSQAVPIGLILNEAITNSIKYAFPDDGRGTISISLKQPGPAEALLSIADSGVGIPDDFDPDESPSLGMNLIRGLSRQLGGKLKISNSPGLTIILEFPIDNPINTQVPKT
ncbi:histidine kinase dimerization/phosphoacceptor domain -containing protein [Mucilaginibacter sp. SJ]|uniref:histidine kinase dimerization/phosphoacceptor domain -containing protein n=1 Tax=Mucilaginibacter sp. SJ TaxID=3029053 RepID=UPI0023A9BF55|nr:histidine kinase dimerization/phosphoacceptor domain -containing protein [Mucilaginibacter sp. SJ]WEA01803.1 histidine kinase dimerization/phosphoacceptor domain -containing protein [Mucilaginibacter sp. SJ]